jgi:hypothetical protein
MLDWTDFSKVDIAWTILNLQCIAIGIVTLVSKNG